jgi:hypothetical protein
LLKPPRAKPIAFAQDLIRFTSASEGSCRDDHAASQPARAQTPQGREDVDRATQGHGRARARTREARRLETRRPEIGRREVRSCEIGCSEIARREGDCD